MQRLNERAEEGATVPRRSKPKKQGKEERRPLWPREEEEIQKKERRGTRKRGPQGERDKRKGPVERGSKIEKRRG